MSIFEALRALDDREEPRTLRFHQTDMLLWPFVRWFVFAEAQQQALAQQPAFATNHRASLRDRGELLLRSQLRGPLSVKRPFDIVAIESSVGQTLRREGRWFDRISDYFVMELPERTLVLDRAHHGKYKRPRYPSHVRCWDTFDIRAGIRARISRPLDRDVASIDRLVSFVKTATPVTLSESVLAHTRELLLHWAVRLPLLRDPLARFFDLVRPKVLFIEDASYGAFAHVCRWARAAGIATAEFQHGVISRAHLAYNYGDRGGRELADHLPQYLLVYGELWAQQVRTPSEAVVVGCPHFSESTRAVRRESPGHVLTISQGICTDAMVRITRELAARHPTRRFVFRPHPGELAFRERYASLETIANVEVNTTGDLFEQLGRSALVIGHSSTALVEAAGMGAPVCVLDDEGSRSVLPAGLGTWFTSVDQVSSLLDTPASPSASRTEFFADNWRENYQSFIARVAAG
ncbi:MAG: hypothetical protein HOV81_08020 [Kofleriaceae bacterium]|nr:hypothetical protein [Kofleriaceae bacterium]